MTGNKINIWFPTVASGEELYSLCILLKESIYDNAHILATDLNQNILKTPLNKQHTHNATMKPGKAIMKG